MASRQGASILHIVPANARPIRPGLTFSRCDRCLASSRTPGVLGPGSGAGTTRGKDGMLRYTDAVVTPPSITMVWPVMKLAASEPR